MAEFFLQKQKERERCMKEFNKKIVLEDGEEYYGFAFGADKEGQDYRACAAYGPMYK